MELKVGCKYRSRSGSIVTITAGLPNFPNFAGKFCSYIGVSEDWLGDFYYHPDGNYNKNVDVPEDLIEEIDMSLKLEVGKTFLTREGNRCKIVEENNGSYTNFYKFEGIVKTSVDVPFSYSAEGKLFIDEDSPNDLVSETTPEVVLGQTYITKGGSLVTIECKVCNEPIKFRGATHEYYHKIHLYNEKGIAEGCYTEDYDLYKFVVETKEVKEEVMKTIKPNSWYITKENTLLKVESQSTLNPDIVHCYGNDLIYAVDDLAHEVTEEVNAIFEKYKPKLEIKVGNYYLHENGEVVKVDFIDSLRHQVHNVNSVVFDVADLTKDVTEQIKCLL